ncbi:hypothetical protein HDU83_008131 [Entophlyctis luteolus]|nr:hypothetical protein HDU83_008131 [Entophlyctis luteolus]
MAAAATTPADGPAPPTSVAVPAATAAAALPMPASGTHLAIPPESTVAKRPASAQSSPRRTEKGSAAYILKTLVAGGLAGSAAKTVIAPMDRVKILFQTSNPQYLKYSGTLFGVFRAINDIYSTYGVPGLFQGHSATLLRIFPYAAIKFMSYEQYKHWIMPRREDETALRRTIAGSMAGVSSLFLSYPLDLLRTRLAYEIRSAGASPGLLQTWSTIYHEPNQWSVRNKILGGTMNFYRGFVPTVFGMIPYAGVSFMCYEGLKAWALEREGWFVERVGKRENEDRTHLTWWAQLSVGGVSGLVAQTASYPFEVIRRQMQIGGKLATVSGDSTGGIKRFPSMIEMTRYIYQKRGLRGFFVGLSIGFMKVVPMHAVVEADAGNINEPFHSTMSTGFPVTARILGRLVRAGPAAAIAAHILSQRVPTTASTRAPKRAREEPAALLESHEVSAAPDDASGSSTPVSSASLNIPCADNAGTPPQCLVLADDAVWEWQSAQEQAMLASLSNASYAEQHHGDHDALNGATDSDASIAVAMMWEPHRAWYGSHAWWAFDQTEQQREDGIASGLDAAHFQTHVENTDGILLCAEEPPRKILRVTNEPDYENGPAKQHSEDNSVDADTVIPVGTVIPIDVLLVSETTADHSPSKSRKKRRQNKVGPADIPLDHDELIGMEVQRDIVYDESELTPEEIAIQRWSIAWREKRAAENAQELAEKMRQLEESHKHEQELLRRAHEQHTYAHKSTIYPSIYGTKANLIIQLEAQLHKRFEESGGVGYTQHIVAVGEEHESYNKVPRRALISSSEMVSKCENSIGSDSMVEDGELAEEGEIGEIAEMTATRVIWPVLPIRPLL